MAWNVHDYPEPPDYFIPTCPICGSDCEYIIRDKNGGVIGCDECIQIQDADEYWLEQEELALSEKGAV